MGCVAIYGPWELSGRQRALRFKLDGWRSAGKNEGILSIERKLRRAQAKKSKKNAEKEMAAKVALFGKIPNKCLTCEKPFDKMDREQVKTWSVVVRQQEDKVNLYCPSCWEMAVNLIKEVEERRKDAVLPTE